MPRMGELAAQDNYGSLIDWSRMNQPFGALFDPNPKLYDTKAGPIYQDDINQAIDVAMGASGGGMTTKGIKAYHGSPHDFDKFDLSKIGTGEGAQAYGHGLYFAENPIVAESYKGTSRNGLPWWHPANAWTPAELPTGKGHMYEVNINADPVHFLDWDKALSAQIAGGKLPPAMIDQAKREAYNRALASTSKQRADELWNMVKDPMQAPGGFVVEAGKYMRSPEISAEMSARGIPGIKYFDQGSRGTGQGSSNYVVFNDKLIEILRKYGIAGAAPAGMGALAAQDNYQP